MTAHTPSGYLDDNHYPATYQRELSPAWLRYAAAVCGRPVPRLDRPFRYLELGCGQGRSVLIHAAAFPQAEFHACDANRAAIDSARGLADALAIGNVIWHACSFAELRAKTLPRFDFVVAHGVYSWIDEAVQAELRRTMSRALAPGGIAYLSYNCLPGWAAELSLRRMMVELATAAPQEAGATMPDAATGAVQTLARLADDGAAYFREHPAAQEAVAAYAESPAGYLAHEFLNSTLAPRYSVDVAEEMTSCGLEWIGSATLADNHPTLLVGDRLGATIAALPRARLRELAMDLAVNRRFRRDLFQRRNAPAAEDSANVPLIVGHLVGGPGAIPDQVRVPRGRLEFGSDLIGRLRHELQSGSADLSDLVLALAPTPDVRLDVLRNLLYLVAGGALAPFARYCHNVQTGVLRFASDTARFAVRRVAASTGAGWIPSPVAGAGIRLGAAEAVSAIQAVEERLPCGEPAAPLARLVRLGVLAIDDFSPEGSD